MAARSSVPRIIFILLGLYGWLTALMLFLKYRRQAKEKEERILHLTRTELDSNAILQRILSILNAERNGEPIQDHLSGNELRQLPAFLEDLGSHWEFDSVSIEGAYNTLGQEVIWCDESKLMWQDEQPPRSDTYWRLFNKFAKAIQAERARRQTNA
ncbi:MAG TPA: hypothetical protein VLZ30_03380 [Verrucomicrobiae bacterium]|nr:hypothetical protein [Verrucomicrobiae bacterium]